MPFQFYSVSVLCSEYGTQVEAAKWLVNKRKNVSWFAFQLYHHLSPHISQHLISAELMCRNRHLTVPDERALQLSSAPRVLQKCPACVLQNYTVLQITHYDVTKEDTVTGIVTQPRGNLSVYYSGTCLRHNKGKLHALHGVNSIPTWQISTCYVPSHTRETAHVLLVMPYASPLRE